VTPPNPTSQRRRPLSESTAFAYLSSVAAAAISLVNVAVTARVLGAEGRGQLVFLITIASLGSFIASLGVHQAVANFAGSDPSRSRSLAGASVVWALVLGTAAAAVVIALLAAIPTTASQVPLVAIVLVLVCLPVGILELSLQHLALAHYAFAFHNATWVLPRVVSTTVNVLLAVAGALTVSTAIAVWLAGQLVGVGLLWWAVVNRFGGFGLPKWAELRALLSFGLRDHLGRVLTMGSYGLDQWLVGALAGATALGTYSVAVAWVEALYFLPSALVAAQRPDLVRIGAAEARELAARGFRYAVWLTIPTMAGLMLLAPFLTGTLFGEEFRDSETLLRILTLGAVGVVALKVLSNALTAQGRPMLATAAAAVTFVTLVVLMVLLVPTLGAQGAAIGTASAFLVGGAAVAAIFLRHFGGRARLLVPGTDDVRGLGQLASHQLRRPGHRAKTRPTTTERADEQIP
jgi:O-antigen/teichoic acid export membrane protein